MKNLLIRHIWAACLVTLWTFGGSAALAQVADPEVGAVSTADVTVADVNDAVLAELLGVDFAAWSRLAERTEGLLLRNVASVFALERLRSELLDWQDVFSDITAQNAARLKTVESQIAALGVQPVDGATEAAVISARRDVLTAFRDELAAPSVLANEANARATGLLGEVEVQIRLRQAAAMWVRGALPVTPAHWGDAAVYLYNGIVALGAEVSAALTARQWFSGDIQRAFWGIFGVVAGFVLFIRNRKLAHMLVPHTQSGIGRVLADFFETLLHMVLPLIGLVALTYGLTELDIFGARGEAILATLPRTGSVIIIAGWLGRQFFPTGGSLGPLEQPPEITAKIRRTAVLLAWLVALRLPFEAFLTSGEVNDVAVAVLHFPFTVIVAVVLFRFASLLRHRPVRDLGTAGTAGRTRSVAGRLVQAVAIAAPILAALGFDAAARGILFPTCLTLGLLGVVIYLQTLSYRVYELWYDVADGRSTALAPVFIGFFLFVMVLPVLAIVWGAKPTDLFAAWVRFTEGVSWGDTQISPMVFLTFALVFSVGYMLTRFIKTTLRGSVLPRTSLDLGAQDAIVAGFGYVGIFLSAVLAITSAGIDLSSLAIVAGALSVGIGFGLQNIVSNFVAGIILLIERPIGQGDWIEVGDRMGYVRSISVRSTRIETFDRSDVIVPNADLISNQVINWTRGNLAGRLILKIGVAYGSDVDKVAGILRDIAEAHPMVIMTPPPAVMFMNFGADALEFEIRAILRDVNFVVSTQSELNFAISRRFTAENIEIPFAQRDIWLRNPEVLRQHDSVPKPTSDPAAPFQQMRQRDTDFSEPEGGDIQ